MRRRSCTQEKMERGLQQETHQLDGAGDAEGEEAGGACGQGGAPPSGWGGSAGGVLTVEGDSNERPPAASGGGGSVWRLRMRVRVAKLGHKGPQR